MIEGGGEHEQISGELHSQFREMQEQIAALKEQVARHEQELKVHEGSISRVETNIHYILSARVWRTLQFAGRFASRFLPEKSRTPWAPTESEYHEWIRAFDEADRKAVDSALPQVSIQPLISIIVPVFNTDPLVLESTIRSVQAQSYKNWELCLADDHSTRSSVVELLKRFAAEDDRIKVVFRSEQGGISQASNSALEIASGEYLAFLDHDDVLTEHALAAVCEAINERPEVELIYSDEDKLDNRGKRYHPVFKTDWAPDLLLSSNYICHFLVVKRTVQQRVGGLRSEFDGSQDYDFLLRIADQKPSVVHIPKVLYHWRAVPGSTAGGLDSKSYAVDAARRALADCCARRENGSRVEPAGVTGWWRVRYPVPEGAAASIIVDAGGSPQQVRSTLDSILEKTGYRRYEIVVVSRTRDAAIASLKDDFKHAQNPVEFVAATTGEAWSAAMNAVARRCQSAALIFLSAPSVVLSSDWLSAMIEHICRPEIGAIGPKVLARNGAIASAGVVLGVNGIYADAFAGLHGATPHYFGLSNVVRNVSAVSARCLGTSNSLFAELGGFKAEQFPSELGALDYCLRASESGRQNICTPYALLQQEATAAGSPASEETARFAKQWATVLRADPFYNVNLTRDRTNYSLRRKKERDAGFTAGKKSA